MHQKLQAPGAPVGTRRFLGWASRHFAVGQANLCIIATILGDRGGAKSLKIAESSSIVALEWQERRRKPTNQGPLLPLLPINSQVSKKFPDCMFRYVFFFF